MTRLRALILFLLAILAFPSAAYADVVLVDPNDLKEALRDKGFDWLKDKAKSGAEDWLFETGQSETMHAILVKARERADGPGNGSNGRCQGHVMGKASDILNNINTAWTVRTVARFEYDTMTKLATMASGMTGAAAEGAAMDWLVSQYVDAAKGEAQDAVMNRIKKFFFDEKEPEFELYETSGTNGPCDYTVRALWDKANGTYRVYIAGDCHCQTVGVRLLVNPTRLGKWWISFEGHMQPVVDKSKDTVTWVPSAPRMDFDAQCNCSNRKLRDAFAADIRVTSQVATVPGIPTIPATPTTPVFTAPTLPAQPSYASVAIPSVPRFCSDMDRLRFLTEVLDPQQERANENAKAASVRLLQLDTAMSIYRNNGRAVPPEYAALVATAQADYARWQQMFDALAALHRQVMAMKIEPCDDPKDRKVGSVPSGPPCSTAVASLPPDPVSRSLLAYQNTLRAEVGSPPLRWNPVLAAHATEWAGALTRMGRLQHSPRDSRPKNERENLVISRHGANSPMQMISTWGQEKALFRPGVFPDVCNGDWSTCAHYTQLVWSTTTEVGCGFVSGPSWDALVCRYSPPGNRDGSPVLTRVVPPPATPCPEQD
jgi:hypothetical protein